MICLEFYSRPNYLYLLISVFQAYADEGHDLKGVIEHVYRSMEDFLRECLSLDPEDTKLPPPDR